MRTEQATAKALSPIVWMLAIGLVLSLWGASGWGAAAIATPTPSPRLTLQQLQSMPSSVQFGGHSYRLEVSLWRDFMPIVPQGGPPLYTGIQLIQAAAVGSPKGTATSKIAPQIDTIWIIQGPRVWRSTAIAPPQRINSSTIETTARNGPKLEPQSKADVVIQLRDREQKLYWIRATNQTVMATY